MTADMIRKARAAAEAGRYGNVEFRLGEIEHIPVADNTVDVIMSNSVISADITAKKPECKQVVT